MFSLVDDDLGTEQEITQLQAIFEDAYRFSTVHFKIPSSGEPEFDVEEVLSKTKSQHCRNDNGLLIIYYGGHGEIDKMTQHSIWKAWKIQPLHASAPSSPWVDWSDLQEKVMNAKGDILFILDCCYASNPVRHATRKHKGQRHWLLASWNEKASNQNTLTKAFIHELKDLDAQPCSVFSIHARLLENPSIRQLKSPPFFDGVRKGDTCILLAPLRDPLAQSPSDPHQAITLKEDLRQLQSRCRILISVTLTEFGEQCSGDAWVAWFRDHAPPNIAAISFLEIVKPVATFESDSYIRMLSLPVSVWNSMTPNAAIKFLSIIYSGKIRYDDYGGSQRRTAAETPDFRRISKGRFGQLLGNDSLAKRLNSFTDQVERQDGLVQNFRRSFKRAEMPSRPKAKTESDSFSNWLKQPKMGEIFYTNTNSESRTLDLSLSFSSRPQKFYRLGRVFRVLWSEPASVDGPASLTGSLHSTWEHNEFGKHVYSEVRTFVVIREGTGYCNVLTITSYAGKGVAKRGVRKSEHCIIYTGRSVPTLDPAELPSRRGEEGMRPISIRMYPDMPRNVLDPMSRVNLGKVMTVEHNLEVQPFGKVRDRSLEELCLQFMLVWQHRSSLPPKNAQAGEAEDEEDGEEVSESDTEEDEDESNE